MARVETEFETEQNLVSFYPRSFLQLIVYGTVLVMAPLLAAVGYASLRVDDLTHRSGAAMRHVARAASLARVLPDELGRMERLLRQYEVLHDPSLLEDYYATRAEWRRSAEEYVAIPLLGGLAGRIGEMLKAESVAYRNLGDHAQGVQQLQASVVAIERDLPPLLDEANRLVDTEREKLRVRAEVLWQRLLLAVLLALVLSSLLLWFGRRTLARLWSRFEEAVRALGEGSLEQRIRLDGPEDLQLVGHRLEWLRQRLLALETERTRVMRHASHELKTPLATLREGASLLSEGVAGPLTPQQEKIAGIMQANALRLQGLIEELLRMQRASFARDHMETSPVRFDKLIEQTLATYQLVARSRKVRVAGTLAPITIQGGSEGLATLANNLVSNAVKFSPEGGIVRIALTREGDNAVLDVIDEGPGITAEDRERIFEPFYRGSAGGGTPGAGLGLAIAHEYALAHRGRLEVVDEERGAHFRAVLPMAVPA